jgi:drug/metabolite transporter (DMT)-like permease
MRVSLRTRAPSVSTAPLPLVYAGLWFVVIAWGGSFVAARALLYAANPGQASLSPTVLAALRFSIASLFFILPLARAILRRQLSRGDLVRLAILGQITYSTYFWLQYTGVQLTNAGIASILVIGLMPLATALFAQLLGVERLSWRASVAFLLGFLGVVLIVLQGGLSVGHNLSFAFGCLCLIGNAIAFAVYSNLSKRWMRTISPIVMTGGTMVSGALGLLVLALLTTSANQWRQVTRLDGAQWLALLFLALVCSIAAYVIYNAALTRIPASRAAGFNYGEPVVAVVLGALLLGERLSLQAIAGASIIALSVYLLQRRKHADLPASAPQRTARER